MSSLINKLWSKIKLQQRRQLSIMIVGLDNSGKTTVLKQLTAINRGQSSSSGPSLSEQTRNIDWIKQFLDVQPTISYHFEVARYKNSQITVIDFSGQNRYRNLWSEYYNSVDAIIFVIDSTDSFRLVVVKDELELLLSHEAFTSLSSTMAGASSSTIANNHQQQQLSVSDHKLIKIPLNSSNSQHQHKINRKDIGIRKQVPILFMANKMDQIGQATSVKIIQRSIDLQQIPIDRHPWHIQATSAFTGKGIEAGMDWLMSQLDLQVGGTIVKEIVKTSLNTF